MYFDPENIVKLAIEGGCNAVASTFGVLGSVAFRTPSTDISKAGVRLVGQVTFTDASFAVEPRTSSGLAWGLVVPAAGAAAITNVTYIQTDARGAVCRWPGAAPLADGVETRSIRMISPLSMYCWYSGAT